MLKATFEYPNISYTLYSMPVTVTVDEEKSSGCGASAAAVLGMLIVALCNGFLKR